MKKLLFVLLIALLVCPALAQTQTINAVSGQAIWAVYLEIPPGTTGTFTAVQTNGDYVGGTFAYTGSYPMTMRATIGSDLAETTYYVPSLSGKVYFGIWNGDNSTTGRILKAGYGQSNGIWNEVIQTEIERYPITSFTMSANNQVKVNPEYAAISDAESKLAAESTVVSTLAYWLDWLMGVLPDAMTFVSDLTYWIRFFFVDNLAMIVALFLAVPMAFAAKNARGNPEKFLRQYFRTLSGFFGFMIKVWQALIGSIGAIVKWFMP